MKKIKISPGGMGYVLVDDEDYPLLARFKWFKNTTGYAFAAVSGHLVLMQRLIMGMSWGSQVDHKDGNPLNNQKSNLRVCTQSENMMNKSLQKNNTSGVKGVSKTKNGKWTARVTKNHRCYYLGTFDTKMEAVMAYNKKAKKLYGDFAWLNPTKETNE